MKATVENIKKLNLVPSNNIHVSDEFIDVHFLSENSAKDALPILSKYGVRETDIHFVRDDIPVITLVKDFDPAYDCFAENYDPETDSMVYA